MRRKKCKKCTQCLRRLQNQTYVKMNLKVKRDSYKKNKIFGIIKVICFLLIVTVEIRI